MIKLLLDQGLAPRAAELLRQAGFPATHVCEVGLQSAADAEILEHAAAHSAVCITLDHDFHAHLAERRQGRPSVILLRVEGMAAEAQASLIRAVVGRCGQALSEGSAVSADRDNIRIRRLPLR